MDAICIDETIVSVKTIVLVETRAGKDEGARDESWQKGGIVKNLLAVIGEEWAVEQRYLPGKGCGTEKYVEFMVYR